MSTLVAVKAIFVDVAQHPTVAIKKAGCYMPRRKRRIKQADIVQVFAERLRSVRISREMTQRDLAHLAHVTLSYISRLEAGGAAPGIDLLERLAKALQVGLSDLLPVPSIPETADGIRAQIKSRFDALLAKAGRETMNMLNVLVMTLAESPAANR
jgi:transcriptional regulator with XRE-family HTH domain